MQQVLEVESTERLSPHLVRVYFGGQGVTAFLSAANPDKLAASDKYVKIFFAKPGLGLTPPYDMDALRGELALEDLPVRRTYTVRSVDASSTTIAIDFVVHGTEGVAGPWAVAARQGDRLALSGPGGGFVPTGDVDIERLLIGDDSAIPAIGAALAVMPAQARGRAFLEVDEPADELALVHPPGVELVWLHRRVAGAAPGTLLTETIERMSPSTGAVEVFAHGERSAMKAIGKVLQDVWRLDRRAMSLSAYWALGRAEDTFQAEKRQPVGAIFAD